MFASISPVFRSLTLLHCTSLFPPDIRWVIGFFFCSESVICVPLHGARRAMAAALPLPLAGQRRAFLSIPISDPGRARAVMVGGYPSDSFSPKPPESTNKRKRKTPNPNQIRLFEPPRPPPRPTQILLVLHLARTPLLGDRGLVPGSLRATSAVGAAIFHRTAPVLPIRISPLLPACSSTCGV